MGLSKRDKKRPMWAVFPGTLFPGVIAHIGLLINELPEAGRPLPSLPTKNVAV
jgi:hypothetical protein